MPFSPTPLTILLSLQTPAGHQSTVECWFVTNVAVSTAAWGATYPSSSTSGTAPGLLRFCRWVRGPSREGRMWREGCFRRETDFVAQSDF